MIPRHAALDGGFHFAEHDRAASDHDRRLCRQSLLLLLRWTQLVAELVALSLLVAIFVQFLPLLSSDSALDRRVDAYFPPPYSGDWARHRGTFDSGSSDAESVEEGGRTLVAFAVVQLVAVVLAKSVTLAGFCTHPSSDLSLTLNIFASVLILASWVLGLVAWAGAQCLAVAPSPYDDVHGFWQVLWARVSGLGPEIRALYTSLCLLSKALIGPLVLIWVLFVVIIWMVMHDRRVCLE